MEESQTSRASLCRTSSSQREHEDYPGQLTRFASKRVRTADDTGSRSLMSRTMGLFKAPSNTIHYKRKSKGAGQIHTPSKRLFIHEEEEEEELSSSSTSSKSATPSGSGEKKKIRSL